MFFQVFQHGTEQLLSRAWLIDPGQTQANVASSTHTTNEKKEPWNGEFYASFGSDRPWEEARKYGFISGGGGSWYSQTLKLLSPGDRVWVKIPKKGYVGVGRVVEEAQPVGDFQIKTESGERSAMDVLPNGERWRKNANNPEKAEYFIRIDWLDTVSVENAVDEVGFFGNQNTVCQPRTPKWRHTVERLKTVFHNWDKLPIAAGRKERPQ